MNDTPRRRPPSVEAALRHPTLYPWEARHIRDYGGEEDDVAEYELWPSWRVSRGGAPVGYLDWEPGLYTLTLEVPGRSEVHFRKKGPKTRPEPPTPPKKKVKQWVEKVLDDQLGPLLPQPQRHR